MNERCEVCGQVQKLAFPKELEPIRRREIGLVEVRAVYDGALYRQCMWCLSRTHRFNPGDALYELARPYVDGEK
jgi:hypothetical protein